MLKQIEASSIQINWLHYQQLFDFDQVKLINATDQDVEAFAIQAGNDVDMLRKRKIARMTCMISPSCVLQENTLRILKHIFGNVVSQDKGADILPMK